MKALFFDGKPDLKELPEPVPERGEALIKVLLAGICNTDIEIVKGYMGFKGVMGHEFVGEVVDAEDTSWLGKRVVGEINIACGSCSLCKAGLQRHCPERTVLGILSKEGAFAEYLTLPLSNLHLVPENIPDEKAVFTEPLAAALQILEQIQVGPDDRVAVIGDGKLGLLIALVMHLHTGNLVVVGKHPEKLSILQASGITCLSVSEASERFSSSADKPEVVVEATGNPEGLRLALEWARPCGTVVLKSTFAEKPRVDLSPVVIKEITLVGSRCGPFPKALDILAEGKIDPRPLITSEYPLAQAEAALDEAMKKDSLKVVLRC
jgi:threonine dehydrogenase-like Zn-dependent dehydrogenase